MPGAIQKPRAALGMRAHSGWAAVVAVGGSPRAPVVVDRRRFEIADPTIPGSKQPFHASKGSDLKEAKEYLRRCENRTKFLARAELRAAAAELEKKGHSVVGVGVLLGSGRPLPPLAATLASHALIHAAEGEFFRNALVEASRHCKLRVTGVREKELFERAAAELRIPAEKLQLHLAEMGRAIGPPWRQDEKFAALVAWMVLATRG